jgi:hypothetical protein
MLTSAAVARACSSWITAKVAVSFPEPEPEKPSHGKKGSRSNDFDETRVKCFIDGAYMDVCVYDNLCLKSHSDFAFVSKTQQSEVQIDKYTWHTGGVKYVLVTAYWYTLTTY